MNSKKLSLDKKTLVRLQDSQLAAVEAGQTAGESRTRKADAIGALSFASCCRKTCNGPDEPVVDA